MVDLGEAVLDVVLAAAHGEHVRHIASRGAGGVARRMTELDAVVGQDRVDLVRWPTSIAVAFWLRSMSAEPRVKSLGKKDGVLTSFAPKPHKETAS
jgi:hypothetical protein